MKQSNPLNLNFSKNEVQFDHCFAEKLPVGIELFCFTYSGTSLHFSLPVFEGEGFVMTFLDYSGDLQITGGSKPDLSWPVCPGSGILSCSGEMITLRSSSLHSLSVVMISIPNDWTQSYMAGNAHFTRIAEAIMERNKGVTAKLGRRQMSLLSALTGYKNKERQHLPGSQCQVLSLIEYMFCHCHKNFFRDEISAAVNNQEDITLVREVENYISETYCSETLTVDNLLKKTYTSYHKLNFLFKSIHGMTLSEYIRNKRIERSKEMIADKVLSISQIAYEIGYSSISNYILAFKKIYRITPGKYKKQIEKVA